MQNSVYNPALMLVRPRRPPRLARRSVLPRCDGLSVLQAPGSPRAGVIFLHAACHRCVRPPEPESWRRTAEASVVHRREETGRTWSSWPFISIVPSTVSGPTDLTYRHGPRWQSQAVRAEVAEGRRGPRTGGRATGDPLASAARCPERDLHRRSLGRAHCLPSGDNASKGLPFAGQRAGPFRVSIPEPDSLVSGSGIDRLPSGERQRKDPTCGPC